LAQDDKLQDYENAVLNYQNAANLSENALVKSQSYYRKGLLYYDEQKMKGMETTSRLEGALQAFDTLINDFGGDQDANIQAMVSDARVRRADLYLKLDRLDDAITEAEGARDRTMASSNATLGQKIQAQYQVGSLTFQQAKSFWNEDEGAYNEDYKNTSRKSIEAYKQVHDMATQGRSIEQLPGDALIYVRYALYQAGQIAYALHHQKDLKDMGPIMETFVGYVDKGAFGDPKKDTELLEQLQTALSYLATGYFDLARMAGGELEDLVNDKADAAQIGAKIKEIDQYFDKAAGVFKQSVNRFPSQKDAPLWQYQAGEAFYAMADLAMKSDNSDAAIKAFQKALVEYEKVPQLNPQHESAADALFAMSTCYSSLTLPLLQDVVTPAEKIEYEKKVFELNGRLANEYPNSQYAADAFINVGNNYYNQAVAPNLTDEEKEKLYKLAVENYRKALKVESIRTESKSMAEEYLRETENALSSDIFHKARNIFADAMNNLKGDARANRIKEAIAIFNDLTKNYPTTETADIAFAQVGDCYVELEDWDNAMKSYETLINKYAKTPPMSTDLINAIQYAKNKYAKVFTYVESVKVHESTTGE